MKIGILGAGKIAHTVTQTIAELDETECYAIASRTKEKADLFAKQYGFEKAYGSYEEMLRDPRVELVYIATPHSHHYENMMRSMELGKPIICEKAFTINSRQAEKVKAYSQTHQIFAAEAIWTRYMPSRAIIQEVIDSGIVGKVKVLSANLFYNISEKERIVRPELAGGALLDVGVYGINFALMHFGSDIDRIESAVQFTDTGVDGMENISIFYKDGRMAAISAGIWSRSDRQGIFYGEKGYIAVENINNPQSISVYDDSDRLVKKIDVPQQISGYEYEFIECVKAIRAGRTESWSMPLAESVHVMEIMDSLRRQWGLQYPQET